MKKLPQLPKSGIANLPTPLQELRNLSEFLGGPRILVKRDDLTGLGMGGNKVRKLDYLMPVVLESKSDCIVTGAYFQSNWCTAVCAAARKFGLDTVLVKRAPERYEPEVYEGNHLLHVLLGARILTARANEDEKMKEQVVKQLVREGRKPFHIGVGGNSPEGLAGYINAMEELARQTRDMGINVDYVVHATGSGGTQAGSIIGTKLFGDEIKVICSTSGSRNREQLTGLVMGFIGEALRFFKLDTQISADDIRIYDNYAGTYGSVNQGKMEAVKLLAEAEGLIIDPVYTASAMACLIDLCRKKFFRKGQTVVFVHTGGVAALFAYHAPIKAFGLGQPLPWTVPPWHPTTA
jgi:D-cysteine desulfhydrase family pyridoxal phosphate-dependent enzyme